MSIKPLYRLLGEQAIAWPFRLKPAPRRRILAEQIADNLNDIGAAMKKRIAMGLFLLMLLAFAGILVIAWWTAPTNFTTVERFAKIRGGETPEELEELLGSPGSDKEGRLSIFPGYDPVPDGTRVEFADIDAKGLPVGSRWKEWHTGDAKKIVVCFDESGRVAVAARMEIVESWPDKIRRWLRMTP